MHGKKQGRGQGLKSIHVHCIVMARPTGPSPMLAGKMSVGYTMSNWTHYIFALDIATSSLINT